MSGLANYGVLIGKCTHFEREDGDGESPHCQLTIEAGGKKFRAALNVKSKVFPSELAYHYAQTFEHPITAGLEPRGEGFQPLVKTPLGGGLDYIRGNLFTIDDVIALPPTLPGDNNDLSDVIQSLANRAISDPDARMYIFGQQFPQGIHDIHMNQGNDGSFARDNGVWQDGGLIVHTPSLNRWSAVFLAFQSQAIHTNDESGDAEPGSLKFSDVIAGATVPVPTEPGTQPVPTEPQPQPSPVDPMPAPGQRDLVVRIVSAMVNPVGSEGQPGYTGEGEWVQLVNMLPEAVDLNDWAFLNKTKMKGVIGAGNLLPPAGFLRVKMAASCPLGNNGGLITLIDPHGLKIHGVSYTAEQAKREGYPVGF